MIIMAIIRKTLLSKTTKAHVNPALCMIIFSSYYRQIHNGIWLEWPQIPKQSQNRWGNQTNDPKSQLHRWKLSTKARKILKNSKWTPANGKIL